MSRDAVSSQYALRVVAAVARRPRAVPASQEHAFQRIAAALTAGLRAGPVPSAPGVAGPGAAGSGAAGSGVAGPGGAAPAPASPGPPSAGPAGPVEPRPPGGYAELDQFLQRLEVSLWPWQRPSGPPVPGEDDLRELEAGLARRLPRTPEQAEEVEDLAARITVSHRHLLDRVTAGLKHADVAELTPWGLLILVTWLLFVLAGEPGSRPSNDLAVVAIVVAAAAIVQGRR